MDSRSKTLASSTRPSGLGCSPKWPRRTTHTARPILEELEQGKAHVKAFLGVRTQTVDETVVQQFNLTVKAGAYVADVTSDTAAAAAGIKVGDVITKIDDARVTSSTEVGTALSLHHPGDTVKIVLRRGDKDVTVTAKLASHNA